MGNNTETFKVDQTSKKILIVFLIVLIFYLLEIFSTIIIPLCFAFLFATLFQPLTAFLRVKKVPFWLTIPIISVLTLGIVFVIYVVLSSTIAEVIQNNNMLITQLEQKSEKLIESLNSLIYSFTGQKFSTQELTSMIKPNEILSNLGQSFLASLTSFTGGFFWFAIYYVVFLISLPNYKKYFNYVIDETKAKSAIIAYENIQKSIYKYILLKIMISAVTGLLIYFICLMFGIKFALLWGVLAFVLNFIPFVGSIIAVILPFLMAFIQFETIVTPLFFLGVGLGIQQLLGNIIEPVLMGNSLRLNTITAIFGLLFWGYLWDSAGLFLGIPLLVICKIVLENFPDTAIVGRIMGFPQDELGNRIRSWKLTDTISR